MAVPDDDFSFLLAAVRRLLDGIQSEVEALCTEDGRGRVLGDHVLHALQAVARRVGKEEERYPKRNSDASERAACVTLRFCAQLVWGTHMALQWLRRDEHYPLDLGALYFADEMALALIGKGVEVVPVENPDYMYSTSTWPFEWLIKERLAEEIPDGPRPIVLAFPARERHTMLLHCLFAHELSHTAVPKDNLVTAALSGLKASGDYKRMLEHALEAYEGEIAELLGEKAEALAETWVEELFCDGLAFCLLGPSYLFAFAEFGLSTGLSEPDDEHPSMALRSKLLVEMAAELGWDEYLKAQLPAIWSWLDFIASGPSTMPSATDSFAHRVCASLRPRISEIAQEKVGDNLFRAEDWKDSDDYFKDLLDNDILPVEGPQGDPALHREILLSAWLGAIEKHGGDPSAIPKAIGERDYQRFVAKALEMSTAVRIWEEIAG
jgi:hypothetical protein